MKITQLIKSNNALKVLAGAVCVIVFFFGLSFIGTQKKEPATLDLDFSGFNKAFAESSGWNGVRAVATVIRATAYSFNTFYTYLKLWGVFKYTDPIDVAIPGADYYLSLDLNSNKTVNSTVDSGITYTHSLQLQKGNDTGPVALQLYFNNPDDSGNGTGCLLIVKPYYFPGSVCDIDGIFEARVTNGQNTMYISFNGSPWGTNNPSYAESGRVKVLKTIENEYYVSCLAYIYKDGSVWTESVCPLSTAPNPAAYAYYTLAFIAGMESPHYSTAMWGWQNTGKSDTVCELPINPLNYGHFNAASGFVCDGSPLNTSCPDGGMYPVNADVLSVYNGMGTTAGMEFEPAAISSMAISFKDPF